MNGGDGKESMEDILPSFFRDALRKFRFEHPTEVQRACWAEICEGNDCVVCAPTGTGKTLGFLLPVAYRFRRRKNSANPFACVVAPTRELAQQITQVSKKLNAFRSVCVVGGRKKEEQLQDLTVGGPPDVVIATPGRLIELVEEKRVDLSSVVMFVLDEADRMLDKGLSDQLERISEMIGSERQTTLFSATFPTKVEALVAKVAGKSARKIFVGETKGIGDARVGISPTVTQTVHVCAGHKKTKKLMKFLTKLKKEDAGARQSSSVILFCNTKKTVGFVSKFLRKQGERARDLHGDLAQDVRERIVRDFRAGKIQILVATDVAARGLDVRSIRCVVNYDMPPTIAQYVHRVGRTGRQGREGLAYTFFTRNFSFLAPDLVSLLASHEQTIDPNLKQLAADAPPKLSAEERARKRKKRGEEGAARPAGRKKRKGDSDGLSFKDRCWLAGKGKRSSNKKNDDDDDDDDSAGPRKKKRRRGRRGGKKHARSKVKRIPI